MATPSKLDILRAAGKVQRELAAESQLVEADVHRSADHDNVTTRRRVQVGAVEQLSEAQDELLQVQTSLQEDQALLRRLRGTTQDGFETAAEEIEEDAADNVDDVESDPEPRRSAHFEVPEDSPFSQEWFAKMIGAAVAAAASASSTPASKSTKLKITDRKLPDFWEWQPVAWFRLFDRHIKPFKPSEAESFDALLPLLSTAACKHVQPIVRAPGRDPYTRARSALIRHFDKTPRDNAREFRRLESLGDMKPSDMLEHIYGLLPDPSVIYEVVFLDLLPPAARDAALQQSSLSAMAAAADKIVREGSSASQASASISAVTAEVDAVRLDDSVAAISARRPPSSSASRPRPRQRSPRAPKFLCSSHARWGRNSFRCADPSTCHMKDLIRPRQDGPPPPRGSSGNGRAGGQ